MRLKPRSKDQSNVINPEPTPEKKPLYEHYDKDGNRIGPDGYVMTPVRTWMHRILNLFMIWTFICVVFSVVMAILAFNQGQTWEGGLDAVAAGGTMYNGFSLATLMRLDGVMALLSAILCSIINIQGFRCFYERKPRTLTYTLMAVLAGISCVWEFYAVTMVRIIEPIALINFILLVVLSILFNRVDKEAPSLKKAKIAKTVTK